MQCRSDVLKVGQVGHRGKGSDKIHRIWPSNIVTRGVFPGEVADTGFCVVQGIIPSHLPGFISNQTLGGMRKKLTPAAKRADAMPTLLEIRGG